MEILIFIVWVLLCILIATWSSRWGYSGAAGFWGSFFCTPLLATLVLLIMGPDKKEIEKRRQVNEDLKKCPACAELIKKEAKKCRFCGQEF